MRREERIEGELMFHVKGEMPDPREINFHFPVPERIAWKKCRGTANKVVYQKRQLRNSLKRN